MNQLSWFNGILLVMFMAVKRIFLAKAEMKDNIQIRATASYCVQSTLSTTTYCVLVLDVLPNLFYLKDTILQSYL